MEISRESIKTVKFILRKYIKRSIKLEKAKLSSMFNVPDQKSHLDSRD